MLHHSSSAARLYPRLRPPPPPPPPCSPGFWFGHTHRMDITGPAVAGRWIHAKNRVWDEGEWSSPLPKLFRAGGPVSRFRQQAWDEDMQRCLAINGLLKYHEFEHRRWIPEWGPKQPPEPAVGGSENWQVIMEPAPAADDPFSDNSSCRGRQDGAMHQPLAVVDNPQRSCGRRRASRCRPLTKRGMSMLLTCLSYSSISCTHGMPVTFTMNGSGPRSSSAASPHEVKAARARARARARAAKKASARPRHGGVRVRKSSRRRLRTHPECLCLPLSPAVGGKCLPFYQPLAVILTSHG